MKKGQTRSSVPLSYDEDTNLNTPKSESEILAELPSPIQPGTYLLRVTDSLDPLVFDEFNVQIGATASTQLVIRSVEPSADGPPCSEGCAGTLLISGLNFVGSGLFRGCLPLLAGQGELPLPVLDFNPITQEILAELPIEFAPVSGSFLLGVITGNSQGDFDVFDVAFERDSDPENELQTLSLAAAELSLSHEGGTVSINDADADPANEVQVLTRAGTDLSPSLGATPEK